MNLIGKLNAKYLLQTVQSRQEIVNTLNSRIDTAKNDKSWFSFADIDYKNILIDDHRMIIRRTISVNFNQLRGTGDIVVSFKDSGDNGTHIDAEIRPMKGSLWVAIGGMILFGGLVVWLSPGLVTVLSLLVATIVFISILCVSILISRYQLKLYLQSIFSDIGISEPLQKQISKTN